MVRSTTLTDLGKLLKMVQAKMSIGEAGEGPEERPLVPVVNLRYTYLATVSVLMFIVVMGMVTSYSAPATVDMKEPGSRLMGITADQITWVASLPLFSGIIGNGVSGK